MFRHWGSTYRPNYDLAPERQDSERDSEPRDSEQTDRRHVQETRYRPYSNDQNMTRDIDVAMSHLHHTYEYHNAPQYSNYHSFTQEYCADSRDSHHYPSRYEAHRTPRYSSDQDKEIEFPAHLEVVRLVTQSMSVVLLYGIIISTEKRLS